MNKATHRDFIESQSIADFNRRTLAAEDLRSHGKPFGANDIAFLTVGIKNQGDIGASVGIIFNFPNGSGDSEFLPLKIYCTISPLVSAASSSDTYPATGSTTGAIRMSFGKRLLRTGTGNLIKCKGNC
jgi:hypothetical protein